MIRDSLSVALVRLFAAGCSSGGGEAETGSAAVTSASLMPPGFYELNTPGGDRWLNAINLHVDGTFEASVGDSVSNLDGHEFPADGTYSLETSGGKTMLKLNYSFDAHATEDDYAVTRGGDTLTLHLGSSSDFTMKAGAEPTMISFEADGSVNQTGPVHVGGNVVISYAAARSQCSTNDPNTESPVWLFGRVDGADPGLDQIGQGSPNAPVKGDFRMLLLLPPKGNNLVLWLENAASGGCSKWDSNFGKNFQFPLM